MTKAIYRKLGLLAAFPALLLTVSCSEDDMDNRPDGARNGDIRFEIGFAPTDGTVQATPGTRVATDTKFRSTWEDGDAIGIFAAEHGTALAAANNPIHNVKLTYVSADGTWTAAEPLYWPMDGKKLDFYAYYPYDETLTDPLKIAFSVPTDQGKATPEGPAYNRHDLLMAKAGDKGTGFGKGETVVLDFYHALAMVQVNVSRSMIGDYAPDALLVRLDGCTTACVLDLSAQAAAQPSGPALAESITMYPCPNDGGAPGVFAYRALVPVQTIAAGTVMFGFEHGGNTLLRSKPLAQELTLAAGRAETFDMTFPFTSVTVSETERLADLLTGDELAGVTRLKVLGEMTTEDFTTIRYRMPSVVSLDLGGARVKGDTIPDDALYRKEDLQEFIFPRGITGIGDDAFYKCRGLTGSLTIPDGVRTIGYRAFGYCSGLTGSLTIPASVTTIGNSAFEECKGFNGTLTIPAGVKTIGDKAFYNCFGFTGSLTIPASVKTIGNSAFKGCKGFNGTLTILAGVETIGDNAFHDCFGFTGSLTIPGSVGTIGENAFDNCSGLTGTLTILDGVETIGNNAFLNCDGFIGSLTIPASVGTIGENAFGNCSGFTGDLIISAGVRTIGYGAFINCRGFTGSLTIPASVTTIGRSVFYLNIGLTSITCHIPDLTKTTFGDDVFYKVSADIPVYVPSAAVNDYKSHSQWSRFSNIQPIPQP